VFLTHGTQAKALELNVWTSSSVSGASYDEASGTWTVEVSRGGQKRTIKPKHVILATGHSGGMQHVSVGYGSVTDADTEPSIPTFPGQEKFKGKICHSSQYTSGEQFKGKKVRTALLIRYN
jgi:putative flavoprotein involved in K+ transport